MENLTGELALLDYVENKWTKNYQHLELKASSKDLVRKLSASYDFVDGKFFSKKTQQETSTSADSVIFQTAKESNFIRVKNENGFNHRLKNSFSDPKMERAKQLTRKEIQNYLDKRGVVFKDEPGGSEIRNHVIGRIINEGFVAESSDDGNGIALRQLKDGGYWTLKKFEVEKVIGAIAAGMIDTRRTELKQREIEAGLRQKALTIAKHDVDERTGAFKLNTADAERVFQDLTAEHYAQRIGKRIDVPDKSALEIEFANLYAFREGILDGNPANMDLQGRRNLQHFVTTKVQDLETFTIAERETLKEFEDRYRNYENVTTDY